MTQDITAVDFFCGACIYKITCLPTGKVYIGSAFNLKRRWKEHQYHLRRKTHHNIYLQNAWDKYGENTFLFEVIEECEKEILVGREQFWVNQYQSANPDLGFNIASVISAPMAGRQHSAETRSKISIAQKGVPAPQRSRVRPPEEIEKVAATQRGRKRPPEIGLKISASKKGKPLTERQIAGIKTTAAALRGKPLSATHRASISRGHQGKKGKPHTAESRAKMSSAQKNRGPVSEGTRTKMSAARKAYWDKKKAEAETATT